MKKIAIIMGSDSDLPVVSKAADTLKKFGIPFTMRVLSAQRTQEQVRLFSAGAEKDGYGVIICAAGMAAHLAGAVAAATTLPVIGIPVSGKLGGLDSLLSTVQMPSGIPVATVAVDGAANAAYLAAQILALSDPEINAKVKEFRAQAETAVLEKDAALCARNQ